jgi:1,4-dihydroxy-2-naphthoate octaprenyltransferase
MEKKITTSVTAGVIISLIIIVISVLGYVLSLDQQTWFKWISVLVFIGGIIYTCINYANQMDGNVTFGNTFAFGFKTSAVVTCLVLLFSIIFISIFPDIKDKAMDVARKQMEEKNQLSQDQIDNGIAFAKKSFMLFLILGVIFLYLIFGLLSSLVGAAIAKKNPQTPFQNQP